MINTVTAVASILGLWASTSWAQNGSTTAPAEKLPTFGDVVPILGSMERTDIDFADGLVLDLFSPRARTVTVTANKSPLPGTFVTGSTGEGFVSLSPYSWVIRLNESGASDLIAKVEIPYTAELLAGAGVLDANTYVGVLSADGASWVVDEGTRNVHRTENFARIIKMTSLDGEYMLLGRTSIDETNIFVQYGQGETRTVNVTSGGRQEAEFIDGLRFSTVAGRNVRMNVELKFGDARAALSAGVGAVNSFAWVVNTSDPGVALTSTVMFPINRRMLGQVEATSIRVAKRPLTSTASQPFTILNGGTFDSVASRIVIPNIRQLDGQYILVGPGNFAGAALGGPVLSGSPLSVHSNSTSTSTGVGGATITGIRGVSGSIPSINTTAKEAPSAIVSPVRSTAPSLLHNRSINKSLRPLFSLVSIAIALVRSV